MPKRNRNSNSENIFKNLIEDTSLELRTIAGKHPEIMGPLPAYCDTKLKNKLRTKFGQNSELKNMAKLEFKDEWVYFNFLSGNLTVRNFLNFIRGLILKHKNLSVDFSPLKQGILEATVQVNNETTIYKIAIPPTSRNTSAVLTKSLRLNNQFNVSTAGNCVVFKLSSLSANVEWESICEKLRALPENHEQISYVDDLSDEEIISIFQKNSPELISDISIFENSAANQKIKPLQTVHPFQNLFSSLFKQDDAPKKVNQESVNNNSNNNYEESSSTSPKRSRSSDEEEVLDAQVLSMTDKDHNTSTSTNSVSENADTLGDLKDEDLNEFIEFLENDNQQKKSFN